MSGERVKRVHAYTLHASKHLHGYRFISAARCARHVQDLGKLQGWAYATAIRGGVRVVIASACDSQPIGTVALVVSLYDELERDALAT